MTVALFVVTAAGLPGGPAARGILPPPARVRLPVAPSIRVDNVHFIGRSAAHVGSFGLQGIVPKWDMLTMLLTFIPMENTFDTHFLAI